MSISEYLRNLHRMHVQSHITYHPAGGPLLRAARLLMIEAKKILKIAAENGQKLSQLEVAVCDLEISIKPFE